MEKYIKDIQIQFNDVITFSQGIQYPMTDKLFRDWYSAKEKYIKLFNGLIYEYPEEVEVNLSEDSKVLLLESLIDYLEFYKNNSLAEFVWENRNSFFENKVSVSTDKEIPVGMKIIKAFKYFEKNKDLLRQMQDKASQIIQESKVRGKLCFSVHPLDFLSASVNAHNWRSCHSLDGDYRSGNLNYMVDDTTIMCYIKHDDNLVLPLFPENVPWNSKVWRVFLYSSGDDMICAGKQYPFSCDDFMRNVVWPVYTNLFNINTDWYNFWEVWTNDFAETKGKLSQRWFYNAGELTKFSDIVRNGENTHQFNDLLSSSSYIPKYSRRLYSRITKPIIIGGAVKCLCCEKNEIDVGFRMICADCDEKYGDQLGYDYVECQCCGQRIYYEDAIEVGEYSGEYVCHNCYETECVICEACGEVVYKTNAVYDEERECVFCKECWEA